MLANAWKYFWPTLGYLCLAMLCLQHFGAYGKRWAFVDGHPRFLIDAKGVFADGSTASPLDLALARGGGDRDLLWFNTTALACIFLMVGLAGIYDAYQALKARLASHRDNHICNRRRLHQL